MELTLTDKSKIIIIGISGTGKSTFGRKLAVLTGLSLYHMDSMIWQEHWVETDEPTIRCRLDEIASTDGWIIEGWIDHYSVTILERADLIMYLDFPGWLAMWGGVQRWLLHRGKPRPELPAGCVETLDLGYLHTMFRRLERPHIETILAEFNPEHVLRVKSRRQAEQLLYYP